MADKSKTVIVKKIKKGHAAHHGGQWKVAYADFVTAMMAFFLLMWLLAMVSPEKRAAISEYFKHFSLFEQSGQSFMQGAPKILQQKGGEDKSFEKDFGKGPGDISAEDLKEKLRKAVEEKLRGLRDQVMVDVFEGGVRIQIVDTEGSSMFHSGSAEPSERARQILRLVSDNIKGINKRIAIEGHTDAAPLRKGKTTNWELSTDRASTARRELEADGVDPERIARVVGYADTEPLITQNPHDPRNRRISIILMQAKAAPAVKPPAPEEVSTKPETGQEKAPPKEQPAPAMKPEVKKQAPQPRLAPPAKITAPEKPGERPDKKKEFIDPIGKKKPIEFDKPSFSPGIGK